MIPYIFEKMFDLLLNSDDAENHRNVLRED